MEKYGTIPPKFTKAWWEYFWEYYKIHTIAAAAIVAIVGSTAYQCATQTKYDLNVAQIGVFLVSEEQQNALTDQLASRVDEITGNDKIDIGYTSYTMEIGYTNTDTAEYNYAMQMKLTAELSVGETDLYITSKNNAEAISQFSESFEDVTQIFGENFGEDELIKDENGKAYAISLKNSKLLKDAGIDSSDLYLSLRLLYETHADKDQYVAMHANSMKAALALIER